LPLRCRRNICELNDSQVKNKPQALTFIQIYYNVVKILGTGFMERDDVLRIAVVVCEGVFFGECANDFRWK
jgi:hypothetical protein